jgi:hypothetical protein
MWRALETELRQLLNGHEEGNLGYKPRRNLRATAPALDPTGIATGMPYSSAVWSSRVLCAFTGSNLPEAAFWSA